MAVSFVAFDPIVLPVLQQRRWEAGWGSRVYGTFWLWEQGPSLILPEMREGPCSQSVNPPVLHRKETFPRADDPRRAKFARLTAQEGCTAC